MIRSSRILGLLERVDVSFPYNLIHACMFAIAWDLRFILDIRLDFTNKETIVQQETSQRDEDWILNANKKIGIIGAS